MPEGDSVLQLSHRLQFMTGREVVACSLRVPSVALVDFSGETVDRVWPYGKHLFMQFGERILHTHLKMEGTWAIHLAGDRWRKPGHTARVVLELAGAPHPRPIEVVGHSLGLVEVFPTDHYHEKMGYLGPDVLAEEWDREEAYRRVMGRASRSIGTALLDQQNLAGVGNEYRAEACFLCGIHPATPVGQVDVGQVLDVTRRIMWANRDSPVRVTTGVKRAGESSYVFGRNGKPCRRCGTPIEKAMLGNGRDELERVIWWCPRCQPAV
ncbi:Fpg/Nei family DNA glycosylase [Corynebacterium testudinoris]|uniref:DNA-formamidopyrimidine glycosylase family protein n=1 Tax=Corynebacterium testudinoris TaxID=136857 RepID=UPI001C8C8F61|nr:DNA-formamidopyrimidine glycosylase family protein [Corynebacterium testudinoris]MBX8996937.1 Fpg/Nei family DNA glycosylase [Corynebacterium testudinoris]